MKLPQAAGHQKTGIRLGGGFDLIDLFPTTMDILGLKNSLAVSGVSRWDAIKSGEQIPARMTVLLPDCISFRIPCAGCRICSRAKRADWYADISPRCGRSSGSCL